jgi:hypothetical protein
MHGEEVSRALQEIEHSGPGGDRWGSATAQARPRRAGAHEEPSMHRSRVSALVGVALALSAISPASSLAVGKPEVFGPFVDMYTFIGFDCGEFQIEISGTATTTFTVSFDVNGDVSQIVMRVRAPYDTLTNTRTGEFVVNRGEFQETITPIPGTDQAEKSISGYRYFVNVPGEGVVLRDVGRIQYGDLEQTILLWQAGKHDIEYDANLEPLFCGLLG